MGGDSGAECVGCIDDGLVDLRDDVAPLGVALDLEAGVAAPAAIVKSAKRDMPKLSISGSDTTIPTV